MLCREIVDVIEGTYPKHAAMKWDNVGLLVGRMEKEVRKVYVALDATDNVIDDAIAKGADMIVTHHPLIFSPLKKITDEHFIGSRVVKLLQHDISYYAMHTNYDVLGMSELSAKMLGLSEDVVLELTDDANQQGVGRVGKLRKVMTAEECCCLVKEVFQLTSVKVFGDKNVMVEKAAICPGSGDDMIEAAIEKGADVFITGDISHHDGIDGVAQGLIIIDAGHYGLEHIFIKDMADYLSANLHEVEVEEADIIHPFQVV